MKGGGGDRQKQQQEKMEQMENMKNGILSQVVYMVNIIDQKDYYDGLFIHFEPRESPEVTHGQTVGDSLDEIALPGFGPGGKSQA